MKNVRGLEVKVDFGVGASGFVADVRKDGTWECLIVEVKDSRIFYVEGREYIIDFHAGILGIIDCQLTKLNDEFPISVVLDWSEGI
jgi:hypothetical protein